MPRKYPSLADRLIANSYLSDECHYDGTPCWIWMGKRNASGYPQINLREDGAVRTYLAHRLALTVFRGRRWRRGQVAKHLCNNPLCINPMHLDGGSQSSNMRQCVREGRHFTPFRSAA